MTRRDDPAVRRLVNAVLWPGLLGRAPGDRFRRELDDGLAGVVLFAHNLGDDERMTLAAALHASGPVLVGIDEEGGDVTRLEALEGSTLPGPGQLGAVDDPPVTERVAADIARRVRSVGANVVLAPSADVNVDPRNPVIGVRSFGDRPELVARHVAAAVRGIRSAGSAACVKHFPGHGDTHLDSHHALPVLGQGLDGIERMHLPPFAAAVDAGVDCVMTGHLVVPEWGDEPATLTPRAIARLRRMGFDGVVVSDALDMAAVRERHGLGGGAVRALAAGVDLLCIGNPANPGRGVAPDQDERDLDEVQHAVRTAVEVGAIQMATLERAAARVAALAARLATTAPYAADPSPVSAEAWLPVARRALRVDGSPDPIAGAARVVDVRRRPTVAADARQDAIARTLAAGGDVVRIEPVEGAAVRALDAATVEGPVVVLVDALADPAQRAAVTAVAARRPGAVVVNLGVVDDAVRLPLAVVHTLGSGRLAAQAAREALTGARTPAPAGAAPASAASAAPLAEVRA